MAKIITNLVASYLESLNATSTLCAEFGCAFTATNLFLGYGQANSNNSVTVIPYPGEPVKQDKQTPYFQIMVKSTSKQSAINVQQEIINDLHLNSLRSQAMVYSLNSAPLILESQEGGKFAVTVSNYRVRLVQ